MKKINDFKIMVPVDLLNKVLKDNTKDITFKEQILVLIHTYYHKLTYFKYEDEQVNIPIIITKSEILKIFGWNSSEVNLKKAQDLINYLKGYRKIMITNLVKGKFNDTLEYYPNTKKNLVHYTITDEWVFKRLTTRVNAQCKISKVKEKYKKIYNAVISSEIDEGEAMKLIYKYTDNVHKYNSLFAFLNVFINKNFHFSQGTNVNRLYHTLVNMPKELLQFIIEPENDPYIEVDVSNAQSFFLAVIIKNDLVNKPGIVDKEELSRFLAITKNGRIYEYLQELCEMEGVKRTRDEIKLDMIIILNAHPNQKNPLRELFIKHFPSIHAYIVANYSFKDKFAVKLQNFEASICIDLVAEPLGLIPRHDSWLVPKSRLEEVKSHLERVFMKECGVVPNFKTEPLKKDIFTVKFDNEVYQLPEQEQEGKSEEEIYQEKLKQLSYDWIF